jgi:predicted TIM-barrel fold metal-dependent hydrolase
MQTVNRLTELAQSERDQILGRNAARLLGLD